ncbi:MAG: FHA domain-containing protein [Minisyncoccia bacterium]
MERNAQPAESPKPEVQTQQSTQPEQIQQPTQPDQIQQPPEPQVQKQVTQPSKILKIAFIQSPNPDLIGKTIELDFGIFGTISIGRSPENLLQFPDPSVSRRHCLLELKGDKIVLKDLQSTNGTFIFQNGYFEKIEGEKEISPGDVIKFGEGTVIRVIQ